MRNDRQRKSLLLATVPMLRLPSRCGRVVRQESANEGRGQFEGVAFFVSDLRDFKVAL